MSYYSYQAYAEPNRKRRAAEQRDQAPTEQRDQTRSAKPVSSNRALQVLGNRSAPDAERLRAWVRVGLDLGFIEIRDADQIGTARR